MGEKNEPDGGQVFVPKRGGSTSDLRYERASVMRRAVCDVGWQNHVTRGIGCDVVAVSGVMSRGYAWAVGDAAGVRDPSTVSCAPPCDPADAFDLTERVVPARA